MESLLRPQQLFQFSAVCVILLSMRTSVYAVWPCECPLECQCSDDKTVMECREYDSVNFPRFCKTVKHLTISDSVIDEFERELLKGLPNLQSLTVRSTQIQHIHTCAFVGPLNVKDVVFSRVQISTIVSEAFSSLNDMRQIVFEHSSVDRVSSFAFYKLSNIDKLQITNTTVRELEQSAIYDILNTSNLEISQNTMINTQPRPMTNLKNIRLLDVADNDFRSYLCGMENAFQAVVGNGMFKFQRNRLQCTCHMHWTMPLGPLADRVTIDSNVCQGPEEVRNTRVRDLPTTAYCQTGDGSGNDVCPKKLHNPAEPDCKAFSSGLVPEEPVEDPETGESKNKGVNNFSENILFYTMLCIILCIGNTVPLLGI